MAAPHRYRFLILWQSLVVASYRSFFEHLMRIANAPVTLVAPHQFRELGGQEVPCAPFTAPFDGSDIRGSSATLPCISPHVQIVLFQGLRQTLKNFFKTKIGRPIFLCVAEPYSVTALAAWWCARSISAFRTQKALFFTYSAQNIKKNLPLPLAIIQNAIFKRSDAILVCGHGQEPVLRAHGYTGRVIYFPLWYDSTRFFRMDPQQAEQKLNAAVGQDVFVSGDQASRHIRIGYCGSLSEEKGILDLLDAFSKVASTTRAQLFLAGDGPLKATVTSLGASVHYVGRLTPEATASFMNTVDILVVPSRTTPHWKEQFGRVIIEAMACGTVVLGSDSGEIPDVISDRERIFREQDPEDLARVLRHWIDAARQPTFESARTTSLAKAAAYTDLACAQRFLDILADHVRTP